MLGTGVGSTPGCPSTVLGPGRAEGHRAPGPSTAHGFIPAFPTPAPPTVQVQPGAPGPASWPLAVRPPRSAPPRPASRPLPVRAAAGALGPSGRTAAEGAASEAQTVRPAKHGAEVRAARAAGRAGAAGSNGRAGDACGALTCSLLSAGACGRCGGTSWTCSRPLSCYLGSALPRRSQVILAETRKFSRQAARPRHFVRVSGSGSRRRSLPHPQSISAWVPRGGRSTTHARRWPASGGWRGRGWGRSPVSRVSCAGHSFCGCGGSRRPGAPQDSGVCWAGGLRAVRAVSPTHGDQTSATLLGSWCARWSELSVEGQRGAGAVVVVGVVPGAEAPGTPAYPPPAHPACVTVTGLVPPSS